MESFNNFRFQKQRRGDQGKATTVGKGNRGDRLYMFANRQSRGRKQRSRGGGHTDLGRRPAGSSVAGGSCQAGRRLAGGICFQASSAAGGTCFLAEVEVEASTTFSPLLPLILLQRSSARLFPAPGALCARARPRSHSFARDGPRRPPSSIPRHLGLLGTAELPPSSA